MQSVHPMNDNKWCPGGGGGGNGISICPRVWSLNYLYNLNAWLGTGGGGGGGGIQSSVRLNNVIAQLCNIQNTKYGCIHLIIHFY